MRDLFTSNNFIFLCYLNKEEKNLREIVSTLLLCNIHLVWSLILFVIILSMELPTCELKIHSSVMWTQTAIDHFRITLNLIMKARLSAKFLL